MWVSLTSNSWSLEEVCVRCLFYLVNIHHTLFSCLWHQRSFVHLHADAALTSAIQEIQPNLQGVKILVQGNVGVPPAGMQLWDPQFGAALEDRIPRSARAGLDWFSHAAYIFTSGTTGDYLFACLLISGALAASAQMDLGLSVRGVPASRSLGAIEIVLFCMCILCADRLWRLNSSWFSFLLFWMLMFCCLLGKPEVWFSHQGRDKTTKSSIGLPPPPLTKRMVCLGKVP